MGWFHPEEAATIGAVMKYADLNPNSPTVRATFAPTSPTTRVRTAAIWTSKWMTRDTTSSTRSG